MSVDIPLARIASRAIRPRLFSGNQEGVLGGIDLPIPRLGDRFAVDIATTQLRQDAQARLIIAALTEASTRDARISLPPLGLLRPRRAGGNVVVDGSGQQGSTINLRGAQRAASVERGQYLTLTHGGVGFVHMVTRGAIADQAGRLSLVVWPMLRFIAVDGEPCAIDAPFIEGRLTGFDRGALFVRNRVAPLQFSIEERA